MSEKPPQRAYRLGPGKLLDLRSAGKKGNLMVGGEEYLVTSKIVQDTMILLLVLNALFGVKEAVRNIRPAILRLFEALRLRRYINATIWLVDILIAFGPLYVTFELAERTGRI